MWAGNHPRELGVLLTESPSQGLHDSWMIRPEINEDMANAGLWKRGLANEIMHFVEA